METTRVETDCSSEEKAKSPFTVFLTEEEELERVENEANAMALANLHAQSTADRQAAIDYLQEESKTDPRATATLLMFGIEPNGAAMPVPTV